MMEAAVLHTDLVPVPSSTSLRKALSKTTYSRGKHCVKQAINDWLVNIALAELDGLTNNLTFTLLLETGAVQTIETLLTKAKELHIQESTIIVPNPSLDECAKINAAYPNCLTVPTTSHELLRLLTLDTESLLTQELQRRGWIGKFDVVWLDYCGTFNSRAGRKRQADIRTLFRYNMIPSPGLLVVTASQRGAVTYYTDEVVDMMLGFIKHVASGKGTADGGKVIDHGLCTIPRETTCAGVAVHNITSRMYTVAGAVVVPRAAAVVAVVATATTTTKVCE
jgi:hypothetical protein